MTPHAVLLALQAAQAAQTAQAVTQEWSPLPIIGFGTLISICTAAVGYGVLRSKVDRVSGIETKMNEIAEDVAEIRGALGLPLRKRA